MVLDTYNTAVVVQIYLYERFAAQKQQCDRALVVFS